MLLAGYQAIQASRGHCCNPVPVWWSLFACGTGLRALYGFVVAWTMRVFQASRCSWNYAHCRPNSKRTHKHGGSLFTPLVSAIYPGDICILYPESFRTSTICDNGNASVHRFPFLVCGSPFSYPISHLENVQDLWRCRLISESTITISIPPKHTFAGSFCYCSKQLVWLFPTITWVERVKIIVWKNKSGRESEVKITPHHISWHDYTQWWWTTLTKNGQQKRPHISRLKWIGIVCY